MRRMIPIISTKAKRFIIPAGVLGILIAAVGGILNTIYTVTYRIPAEAQMMSLGVGVYWDVTCTGAVTRIDWGTLSPNQSKAITIYIKNTGNAPINCSISTSNWLPEGAGVYFDLSWDFGSSSLDAGRVRKVTLTLHVHPDITGISSFSFDIIITGMEA